MGKWSQRCVHFFFPLLVQVDSGIHHRKTRTNCFFHLVDERKSCVRRKSEKSQPERAWWGLSRSCTSTQTHRYTHTHSENGDWAKATHKTQKQKQRQKQTPPPARKSHWKNVRRYCCDDADSDAAATCATVMRPVKNGVNYALRRCCCCFCCCCFCRRFRGVSLGTAWCKQ